MHDNPFLLLALEEARAGAAVGEVPVGAVIVDSDGNILAASGNRVERDHDPTAHAEMVVIRAAAALTGAKHLSDFDLYVTLEPCTMCASAIAHARIRRLVFGAYDVKGGGVDHGAKFFQQPTCHHIPEIVGGMMEQECAALLKDFFKNKRG